MPYVTYLFFRFITFPITLMPYSWIHALGNTLGLLVFYLYPRYRKRALSNLALASKLALSPTQIEKLAKQSLQSLMITFLEYPKLAHEKNISRIATCDNPDTALKLLSSGSGVIFFCGHQANWELFFLEGTSRMNGVAIGRPIKNTYLYNWVQNLRQKFGGKIVAPKNALKEGLRALKSPTFFGIVGDQGMPNSGFSSPFLGRRAWTSPLPALLSLRTNRPIIVATSKRSHGKYIIHYSDPIQPSTESTPESLMTEVLAIFEKTIIENPSQWLWIHNRWKQSLPTKLPKRLRQECLAIIFPTLSLAQEALPSFKKIYPLEFITAFIPQDSSLSLLPPDIEYKHYKNIQDILTPDYRFKLIYDFTHTSAIKKHFLSLGAFHVETPNSLQDITQWENHAS